MGIGDGESVLSLAVAAQEHGGLQTQALINGLHSRQVRAYGVVADLQQLTELSNSYANAKSQLNTARARQALSKAAHERAQTLFKGSPQTISLAQYQAVEAAFEVDQVGLAAAQTQLRAVAQTARQLWGVLLAQALVDDSPLLARLIDHQDVLVQLTLHPGEEPTLTPALAFLQADSGSRVPMVFTSAAPRTDARIQGPSFFYTAPAASGLQPGMNVLAFLQSDQDVTGVVVPPSAVVWAEGRAWVYLQTGSETFSRREIATDLPAPAGGYVVGNLPDQARIVSQGAQMLLSEEFRAQIRVGD